MLHFSEQIAGDALGAVDQHARAGFDGEFFVVGPIERNAAGGLPITDWFLPAGEIFAVEEGYGLSGAKCRRRENDGDYERAKAKGVEVRHTGLSKGDLASNCNLQ